MKVEGDNQRAEALGERTVTSSTQDRESRYKNESEKDTPYSLDIDHALPISFISSNVSGGEQAQERRRGGDVNCSALAAFAHKLMNAALSRKSNTCVAAKVNLHIRKKIAKNLIIYYVNA